MTRGFNLKLELLKQNLQKAVNLKLELLKQNLKEGGS
jgi:hypothetical protein